MKNTVLVWGRRVSLTLLLMPLMVFVAGVVVVDITKWTWAHLSGQVLPAMKVFATDWKHAWRTAGEGL